MLRDSLGDGGQVRVDFRAHAQAMGAWAVQAESVGELAAALVTARASERTSVIVVSARENDWTPGGAFWQVGVPESSELAEVRSAREQMDAGLAAQRSV
jgi:3D-(3,5/4)-trihydroxycyclohexane-1,2-dione acylhydrolase (decyclizing)